MSNSLKYTFKKSENIPIFRFSKKKYTIIIFSNVYHNSNTSQLKIIINPEEGNLWINSVTYIYQKHILKNTHTQIKLRNTD